MNALRKSVITVATLAGLVASTGVAFAGTGAYLRLDHMTVHKGDLVHVVAGCGDGGLLNLVGSEAFAPTGQDGPYDGDGGVAVFTRQANGLAVGAATIRADIAPGRYHVGERCGGGNAGGLTITLRP
jgi:hypothetical protein